MASTYLTRTEGTATSRRKFTISTWIKKDAVSGNEQHFYNSFLSSPYRFMVYFNGNESLQVRNMDNNSANLNYITNRLFRDTSAFYHIVVEVDTTQATASDRVKIYVNGEQETSFSTSVDPSQNTDLSLGSSSYTTNIGRYGNGGNNFDGVMAHYHFVDGTAYDASAFGQADANGVWTIKTSPSVTYGTNGFFILKDGNSVTDQSGNGNNFTVAGGTLTNTEDNPSNVFATMNPLIYDNFSDMTYGNGNTTFTATGANFQTVYSTLAVSSGKYYFELKHNSTTNFGFIGIREASTVTQNSGYLGDAGQTLAWGYYSDNGVIFNNGNTTAYGDSWNGTGDIVSCALDLDNNKLYFAKNGVWQNSGDPTSGATGTGAVSISAGTYYLAGTKPNSSSATLFMNFGNGYFGTTAVASAGTNASGNGIFEYDVPTGYTALSTKGLNL